MSDIETLTQVVAQLTLAAECLRSATLIAKQKPDAAGVAVRLERMKQETADYAAYINDYFAPALVVSSPEAAKGL